MNAPSNGKLERDTPAILEPTTNIALVTAAEIDQQIATARKYPRSISVWRQEARQLLTFNEKVAQECVYTLKRKDRDGSVKLIKGPSIRFAEIIISRWRNVRVLSRVVNVGPETVTAQGIVQDLETNYIWGREAERRITTSEGRRYSTDMIVVTANAACSIAVRNAVVQAIPKALWQDLYDEVERVIAGDADTFSQRAKALLEEFTKLKVEPKVLCRLLGIPGMADLKQEHLVLMTGFLNALRDGETTIEDLLEQQAEGTETVRSATARAKAAMQATNGKTKPEAPPAQQPPVPPPSTEAAGSPGSEKPAGAAPASAPDPEVDELSIVDWITGLDEQRDQEELERYTQRAPEKIRASDNFAKAVKKRLDAIKAKNSSKAR